ncbi:hypothetical protein V5F40_22805 [Xanthobacter sp. DSM 14520]|uniref:hypothetical protein n=1 Tax=Xanthobacter autotrophicus (strain ATCC BAA-1158 / Py2) TaxID=78245 RepID=UPI00372C28C5
MSEVALGDTELDEELRRIRQLGDQALAGDRDALAEFGRRFYALGPKLRAKEQDMAKAMKDLEGLEADACADWAKDAGYIALVDGREAIDIAAFDAWLERGGRAAQEVAAGRDRAFEECAQSVLTHVAGQLGEQLAAAFRARKTGSN